MVTFRYRAMTASGTVVRGVADAANEAAVAQSLREQGHYPLSVGDEGQDDLLTTLRKLFVRRRGSLRTLSIATQELATLLQASLELDRALGILMALGDAGPFKGAFSEVRARIRDGSSLADAMAGDPLFPRFYVGMVRAGELGGTLDVTLWRLSDYLMRTLAIRETVASAMVYPIVLLVTAGLAVTFIITVVLPEFQPFFEQSGKALPVSTQIVMAFGDFIRTFWWLLVLMVVGAFVLMRRALARPAQRLKLHGLVLRIPLLGPLMADIEIERFCRTLGTLLSNGVPLPTGLMLAKDALWNSAIAKTITDTAASLREGESIAQLLEQSKMFPAVTLDLIRVGEETGKLETMLLRQADLDEQRIRHAVDRLLSLLVPGLTILLGLLVGGLIASMLTAILSLNDLATG